ncbi:MAG: beta-fructosidase [Nodosilinea sp.]
MQHPSRHLWDFWYYFDPDAGLFHIFYLNADQALVASEQHHYAACVGHATTPDFVAIDWGDRSSFNVLTPPANHWANTCLWSGDVIKVQNGYLMFYTSRDSRQDDGLTQSIGVAYASDLGANQWRFFDTQLTPKGCYQPRGLTGDRTIHAWRDPFLFRRRETQQIFMLVSAKTVGGPLGASGAIALLQVADSGFAQAVRGEQDWQYLPPLLAPCGYAEMEVPQLYQQPDGRYELVFSCWAKYDFSPLTAGGFQGITTSRLWPESGDRLDLPRSNPAIHTLSPETEGLYACRIVPELGGEIIGFDIQSGGIRRSGIQTHLTSVDRDFSDLAI